MSVEPAVFDARPYQQRHQEPYAFIMRAIEQLQPGQPLRLINTFDPRPLEAVMSAKGFDFEVRELGPEHWEVLFTPQPGRVAGQPPVLDNRGIAAPEAGIRTLQTLRRVPADQGLVAIYDRDPTAFCAELGRRGYTCAVTHGEAEQWRVQIQRSK